MQTLLDTIDWERTPLVPTIAQDSKSKAILMLAYSSKDSLQKSIDTHLAHYFSRSKNRIWQKGEQSGNIQHIKAIRLDCDNDALLFEVEQKGVACHTGELSCFFKHFAPDSSPRTKPQAQPISAYHIIDRLYHIIESRKNESIETSYTAQLLHKGANTICKKIIEEAGELTFALKDSDKEAIIYESADVLYHLLVGLASQNIAPELVLNELERRLGTSGIAEKASRKK